MDGNPTFHKSAPKLLFGEHPAFAEGRVMTCQSLSGTGGLFLAAHVIARLMPGRSIYLPTPTWPIHAEIFGGANVPVKRYRHYDPRTCGLDADGMLADLKAMPHGSIVLFHACAHNPSGVDPSAEQWAQIAKVVAERRLVPLVDAAYQGLASGDVEKDAEGTRLLAAIPGVEMMAVQSFSKIMGLYSERCGAFSLIAADASLAEKVRQEVCRHVRQTYSSPPRHGAAIAAEILNTPERRREWEAVRPPAARARRAAAACQQRARPPTPPPPAARRSSR